MAKQERIVFDLVEGGDGALPDGGGRGAYRSGGPSGAWPRFAARVLRVRSWVVRHRATSLVATVIAAAMVFSLAWLDVAWERERVERLRAAPGGVVSLAGPMQEAWRYEPEDEIALRSMWWGTELEAVVVGENLVFLEGEWEDPRTSNAPDGGQGTWSAADLVAVNIESGKMAWRIPLGMDPVCDVLGLPDDDHGMPQVDSVTCVFGEPDQREAVVAGVGGALSDPRELPVRDAALYGRAVPISGGLLVRPHFEGEEPVVICSEAGGCAAAAAPDRRAVIRVEDARSGEVRWTQAVEWMGDVTYCSPLYDGATVELDDSDTMNITDSPSNSNSTDIHTIHILAGHDRAFTVAGCGVYATLTRDGTLPEPRPLPFGDSGRTMVASSQEEGVLRFTVRSAEGEDLFTTSGSPVEFNATDGTPSDIVMVQERDNTIRGYGIDGSTLWPPEAGIERDLVLARAGKIVLVEGAETTFARSIHTGRELWTAKLWPEAERPLVYGGNRAVFTDGDIVLIVLAESSEPHPFETDSTHAAEPARLVAVDVDDGQVAWRAQSPADAWFAVDGRLISVTRSGTVVGHRTSS